MKRLALVFLLFPTMIHGQADTGSGSGTGWPTLPGGIAKYPNDAPRVGYPVPEPPKIQNPNYTLPMRGHKQWTLSGARFLGDYAERVCRNPNSPIVCQSHILNPDGTDYDWGFRIYRRDNGAYLGTIDRNVGEEISRDFNTSLNEAEKHHPESMWIARKEAEKAQVEYFAAACASGAVYCTGMAAKLDRYKDIFAAACSAWTGFCATRLQQMKNDIQRAIDNVKAACAKNDQACFDAVTNGGETLAREQSRIEKTSGVASTPGDRPPHDTGRPTTFSSGDTDPWYDSSCQHCRIYESIPAENY